MLVIGGVALLVLAGMGAFGVFIVAAVLHSNWVGSSSGTSAIEWPLWSQVGWWLSGATAFLGVFLLARAGMSADPETRAGQADAPGGTQDAGSVVIPGDAPPTACATDEK